MKKIIGWLIAIVVFVPIFPIIVTIGIVKKLHAEEVSMQELVVKYYVDVALMFGIIAICAIVCYILSRRQEQRRLKQKGSAFGGSVVKLTYASEREKEVLEGVEESGVVELADRINRERLMEAPMISRRDQATPWAVFQSSRAFFKRLLGRWPWPYKNSN